MTHQAAPSFDAEYARVVKAAQTAQARADDFERIVNDCMKALTRAGISNDAPLDQLVVRLVGEREAAREEAEYWRKENRATRDAAARTMEEALTFIAPAAVLERERNYLKAKARVFSDHAAVLQAQLEATQRECAEWRGLAERRRDELAGILEDAQAYKAERRALCDILSADPRTVAGQTLVEALRLALGASDPPRVDVAATCRAGEDGL